MSAERHYQEARRNWMIVGGLILLAVVIDVVRASGDDAKKRTRKR